MVCFDAAGATATSSFKRTRGGFGVEDNMWTGLFRHSMRRVLPISVTAAMLVTTASTGTAIAARASTTKVAYSFTGGANGEYPSTDLVVDRAGKLYGTSVQGGTFGTGTVFRLTPRGTG